jgi:hypothetical protein
MAAQTWEQGPVPRRLFGVVMYRRRSPALPFGGVLPRSHVARLGFPREVLGHSGDPRLAEDTALLIRCGRHRDPLVLFSDLQPCDPIAQLRHPSIGPQGCKLGRKRLELAPDVAGGLGLLGDFYGVSRIVQKLVEVPALDAEQRQTGQEAAAAPQRGTVVQGVGEGGFGEVGVTFRGSGLSRVVELALG